MLVLEIRCECLQATVLQTGEWSCQLKRSVERALMNIRT